MPTLPYGGSDLDEVIKTTGNVTGGLLGGLADAAGFWRGLLYAPLPAAAGFVVGGKEGAKAAAELSGGDNVTKFWNKNIVPTYGPVVKRASNWNPETGFVTNPNSTEVNLKPTSDLDTILAGYGAFDEAAARGADPAILQALEDYNQFLADIAPNVARGRAAISGAYGQAANAGRTAASNIARRGEETALSAQDIYGDAAGEVSDLAQAGGTEVSGLTGPSQAFRSLYGDLYGTGEDLAYSTRGMSDLERQEMEAAALAAQRAGGRAARSFDDLYSNISGRDRYAIQNAIRMSQSQRAEAFDARKRDVLGNVGGYLAFAWRSGGNEKKNIEKFFPGVKNETDIARKLQEYIDIYGPENTYTALQSVGLVSLGGTGG